jgi:cysteine desulfurase
MEHSSVSNVFDHLEKNGYRVSRLGVDEKGFYDTKELKQMINKDTCLASLQLVNSEIGVIQDLSELSQILRSHDILLHTDAVQAFGRLELNVEELGVDALTISAHKFYGPKGTGALYLDHRVDWKPVMPVSSGRRKLKEGTPDVPGIVAMLTAAKEVCSEREAEQQRLKELSHELKNQIRSLPYEVIFEADHEQTVPNILGMRFPGMEGQFLMLECNQAGMGISTGSACKVGSEEPSVAMKALKRNAQEAQQFVRLSFGRGTKKDVIPEIVEKLNVILNRHFEKVKEHH